MAGNLQEVAEDGFEDALERELDHIRNQEDEHCHDYCPGQKPDTTWSSLSQALQAEMYNQPLLCQEGRAQFGLVTVISSFAISQNQ